jgi:TM2 domain-containing membrane protein YozV
MENYLNGKSKVLMAVLCFFFGQIGIHNFILGEVKKGIVKIIGSFLCGVPGLVLMIIDLVKILTDKYEVNADAWF